MPCCVLKTCTNSSRTKTKDSGVTFHRFLRHDHEKIETWIKFVQTNRNEETWLPKEHTYICSEHFKDDDKYITKTGRVYLKECAVPADKNGSRSSASESVSNSESILDTPRNIILKRKLFREKKARKQLAANYKKVLRQNRYLKEKCESYKLIVKNIIEKFGIDSLTC